MYGNIGGGTKLDMRMVKAALKGIIIGIIGGVIIGHIGYIKSLWNNRSQAVETLADLEDIENVYSDEQLAVMLADENLEELGPEDAIAAFTADGEYTSVLSEDKTSISDTDNIFRQAIRLDVVYNGTEEISDAEEQELTLMVRQAVLYGLENKYGKDYNYDMSIDDARRALILSLPDIEDWAVESAAEFGVIIEAKALFTVKYMEAETLNGQIYEAGNYETLEITLK